MFTAKQFRLIKLLLFFHIFKEQNEVTQAWSNVTDLFMASVPACNALAQAVPSQLSARWGAAADKNRQYNCEQKIANEFIIRKTEQ